MATQAVDDVALMKSEILRCIARNGGEVLFTDLEREVDGFKGRDASLCPSGCGEVYYWPGLSMLGINSLIQLKSEGKVCYEPEQSVLYFIDGFVPQHPVWTYAGAKRGYKTPHWAPIAICAKSRKRPPTKGKGFNR